MTRVLIDYGCDVNAVSTTGESALHISVQRGRFDTTMVLLTHGAITNAKGKDGNTPLHLAMKVRFSSADADLQQGAREARPLPHARRGGAGGPLLCFCHSNHNPPLKCRHWIQQFPLPPSGT